MAASSGRIRSYVDVNIWLGKDKEGYTTTSSEGGRLSKETDFGFARCGHVSMEIAPNGKEHTYVSLWPDILVPSLRDDQSVFREKTLPDVIVRLHNLDIERMLEGFAIAKQGIDNHEIHWSMDLVSNEEDVIDPVTLKRTTSTRASCATFVYTLLKIGGFLNGAYASHVRSTGPKTWSFWNITKCSAGNRWFGLFNWAPWTDWVFSPKGLLLRVAAAAESNEIDREATTEIMHSDRVAVEKTSSTAVIVGTAALATAGAVLIYSRKK